jgi:hypothetical protein
MPYVKLPQAMTINVGRATITDMCKTSLLSPVVINQAVVLFDKEIATNEEEIAKAKGDKKKALEAKLAEKQAHRDEMKALKPGAPVKTKKAPK